MSINFESDEQLAIGTENDQTIPLIDNIESKQKILLQGIDNLNTYNIFSKETEIVASKNSSQSRINASSKIKVNRIVNYEWEQRYQNGNMIAVHKSGQYFAYAIRVDNTGKVRIFHKKLNEKVLLKSFRGRVVDLSFAYYDPQVLLGCVDETGWLQIFKITLDSDSKIQTSVVLSVSPSKIPPLISSNNEQPATSTNGTSSNRHSADSNVHRIIWCMYIPESIDGAMNGENNQANIADDASKVFVLTRKNRADIFHLDLIEQNYDCSRQLDLNEIKVGHLVIDDHKSTILTASFSPDGSAIATSSADGEVSFFKMSFNPSPSLNPGYSSLSNINDDQAILEDTPSLDPATDTQLPPPPKCLKKWRPHENRPVTSLYFLDDHKNPSADAQFWSFILTGTDYNREIKLWSCLKWECLQVIRFSPYGEDPSSQQGLPILKTAIDLSSKYLLLSDITRKCFYVLHLFQDSEANIARCTAISEFILAYPALSFAITDAQQVKGRKFNQLNQVNAGVSQHTSITTAASSSNLNDESALGSENNSLSISACTNDLINTSISSSSSMIIQPQTALNISNSDNNLNNQSNDYLVTMIRLYCIQTKQLQEMQIFLTGDQSINAYNNNSVSPPLPVQMSGSCITNSNNGSQSIMLPLTQQLQQQAVVGGSSPSSSNSSLLHQLLPNQSIQSPLINQKRPSQSNNSIPSSNETLVNSRLSNSVNFSLELKDLIKGVAKQNLTEDSAIIQIVSPPIGVNTAAPLLMTPDAFLNSPNQVSKTNPQQSADIIHSFNKGSTNGTNLSASNSSLTNPGNSLNNLLSSRASSLTQVTAMNNPPPPSQPQVPVQIHNATRKSRRDSSSSSSSTSSSSSSSSTSSSSSSSTVDNEIAAISSNNAQSSSVPVVDPTTLTLLSKVVIDNDDSVMENKNLDPEPEVSKSNQNEEASSSVLQPKPFSIKNWQTGSSGANESAPDYVSDNNKPKQKTPQSQNQLTDLELKNLLIQMTHAIKQQHDEIENLKILHLNSQSQLKSQIDSTFQKLADRKSSLNSSGVDTSGSYPSIPDEQRLSLILQQTINNSLVPKFEKVIKDEVNKAVQNQLNQRLLDPLREQLSRDLAERIKSIENTLKDNVGKLFKSKSTMDSLGQSVVSAMQGTIVNSYRDTFQKVIVPNFEKSCQNMYQQVNTSFSKGTQDYMSGLELLTRQHKQVYEEGREPFINELKHFTEKLHSHGNQVATEMANNLQSKFEQQFRNSNAILQDTIISSVKAIVKEEIQIAMRDQQHTLPDRLINQMRQSGTITPINSMNNSNLGAHGTGLINSQHQQGHNPVNTTQDIQMQISNFLQKGQLNSAFQVALCAADLNLLMNLCELVNPSQVFDQTVSSGSKKNQCQLQQPVILSLIQQLSQELNTNTELKLRYLEEAITSLDANNALTREHTPAVVGQLLSKVQQYMQTHPNGDKSILRSLRMLTMAGQSLVKPPLMIKNLQQQSQHHDTF